MDQYTCNANMAADLMPALIKGRIQFMVRWPRPDLAIIEVASQDMPYLKSEATFLNLLESGLNVDMSKLEWAVVDDSAWPNLNLWGDATHQITFDGGKHWTNVIQDAGDPEYYVACSDGKRSWKVERFPADQVVKRPDYTHTVTGRISDPPPQQIERAGLTHGRTMVGMADGRVEYRDNERTRQPATVGDTPACPMTDTCFDSDPSVVGE